MPDLPLDILDEFRKLKDEVRQLAGRSQMRPAMTQILSGSVVVGEGGTFKVNTKAGDPQFYVGGISPLNPDGSPQRGLLACRQDGSLAISISNITSNPGDPQCVVIRDSRGQTLLAEDAAGGLAAPVFGGSGWYGYTEFPQWTTSSSSWATCMTMHWRKQHPRVHAYYLARCSDASTSGEVRLLDGAGSVIGQAVLSAGAYVVDAVYGPITGAHLSYQDLVWQARVTGGGGTVGVKGLNAYGISG
ncbi:hypothetical protein [Streptomyces sp. LS1784]|uniref:hypothetical protein n=1 Tax=Streptomyces sp. LS1784 TaxID=2851533 RepID=UPI001CCB891D|nr:hypothetical protein [Streptomyces sp. LS1784]